MNSKLQEILDIVSASEDEADDILIALLRPEVLSREEAQEMFDVGIGYDPTTYFDKRDIERHVDGVVDEFHLPDEIIDDIIENKTTITDKAFEFFDESRQDYLKDNVIEAINDVIDDDIRSYLEEGDDIEED